MNDEELETLVNAWIAGAEAQKGSPEHEHNWWALSRVIGMRKDPVELWQFILTAYTRPMSEKAENLFAADPLEELLSRYGAEYIDRVEELARTDDRFNFFLGGVWQARMPAGIWERVQTVRKEVWTD